jgi:glucose-1-phosphate adenylyltransferase
MFDFHRQVEADVTIGVVPVSLERASQFGVLSTDRDDRIISFQEKPDKPLSNLVSMGIYIFNDDVLTNYLLKDALQTDSSHDFGYSVIPSVIENQKVFAYKYDDYWQDIGTPEAYYQAHMDLLSGKFSFNPRNIRLFCNGSDDILRLAQASRDNIRNSIIGEKCVVNGTVENSVLSPGVFVAENATVRNAVVMAGSFIGYGSTICGCIIDEDAEIGEYAHVASSFPVGKEQITVVKKGGVIPRYANVGNNQQVMGNLDLCSNIADRPIFPRDFRDGNLVAIVKS